MGGSLSILSTPLHSTQITPLHLSTSTSLISSHHTLTSTSQAPLSEDELIDIVPSPISTIPSAPSSVSGAGFSGLLSTMQSEWDSLMVETYTLKTSLEETRRELTQALYQNDAAVRVIARLTMER